MEGTRQKVYCAGPLFTNKEREEMQELADQLEQAGFSTFLPQRDGLELTACIDHLMRQGMAREPAGNLMSRAIFSVDIYQVLHGCDALVANLNGRVPDEGTVSEAAMAWSRGKPVVGYKADSRTAFGGQDNPLVAGLFQFNVCGTIAEAVAAVQDASAEHRHRNDSVYLREEEISTYASLGSAISSTLARRGSLQEIVETILRFSEAATSLG